MTESTRGAEGRDDGESPPATPRWVKLFGIVALAVVALVVVVIAVGGGNHGPGRHLGGDRPAERTPAGGAGSEHTPPPGGHE